MATIAQTTIADKLGEFTVTETTLSGADTIDYAPGTGQRLTLRNPTGGSITVTIDGAGSTTVAPAGYGKTLDVSAGYAIAIPAGAMKCVNLDKISAFLVGAVAVTHSGAGVIASIVK